MSVEFYQREQERMELDQQLNAYARSDKRLSHLKASKLQSYWQKICDDEQKSRARNEQLLREFQLVQTHMDALSAKTQRLRMLKEQYELQVEKMYPRWKEKLELKQQQRNGIAQVPENAYHRLQHPGFQNRQGDSSSLPWQQDKCAVPYHVTVSDPGVGRLDPSDYNPQQIKYNLMEVGMSRQRLSKQPGVEPCKDTVLSHKHNFHTQSHDNRKSSSAEDVTKLSNMKHISEDYMEPMELKQTSLPTNQSKLKQQSQECDYEYPYDGCNEMIMLKEPNASADIHYTQTKNNTRHYSDQEIPVNASSSISNLPHETAKSMRSIHNDSADESDISLSASSESINHPLHYTKNEKPGHNSGTHDIEKVVMNRPSIPPLSRQKTINVQVKHSPASFTSEIDHTGNKNEVMQHEDEMLPQDVEEIQEDGDSTSLQDQGINNESEIDSETSLPISDYNAIKITSESNLKENASILELQKPSVTIEGLWQMVTVIELEIEENDVDMLYTSPMGTSAIVAEIIKEANGLESLQHLNPNTVSMVVLRQLPLIIGQSTGRCLISDKLLTSNVPCSEITVRSYMYSSSLAIWDRLLHHFAKLLQHGALTIQDIAQLFAPLMVKAESQASYKDKAIAILKRVLADMPLNTSVDETTSSMTVTPRLSPHSDRTPTRQDDGNQVPALDLEWMNNDSQSEDSDQQSQDSIVDQVPLNETDTYQQMIKQLSIPGNDVSEEELSSVEDLGDEAIAALEPIDSQPPESSLLPSSSRSNKGRRNILSSLGGMGSLGLSYGDDSIDDGSKSAQSPLTTGRSEYSEAISPLEPTMLEPADLPSILHQSMNSTGKSGKSTPKRSAAFWGNESDIDSSESEMTVPMGTGTMPTGTMKSDGELNDDFDFYD